MRSSTAYFAGVGTVVVAIAAGIGGGLTLANIMSPSSPGQESRQELSKLDRQKSSEQKSSEQKSSESIRASNEPLEPVPYLSATRMSAQVAPQPDRSQGEAAIPSRPTEQVTAVKPQNEPEPVASAPASQQAAAKPDTEQPDIATADATKSVTAISDAARRGEPFAKARGPDVRRVERRKADHRQQWADRRRYAAHRSGFA
jgi:hypothetical protein